MKDQIQLRVSNVGVALFVICILAGGGVTVATK